MTDYQRHNTTLDDTTAATLKAYGGGNLSEGIRRAAELVQATETITLASKDFYRLFDTCQSPAPHNEKLANAFRRHSKMRASGELSAGNE